MTQSRYEKLLELMVCQMMMLTRIPSSSIRIPNPLARLLLTSPNNLRKQDAPVKRGEARRKLVLRANVPSTGGPVVHSARVVTHAGTRSRI